MAYHGYIPAISNYGKLTNEYLFNQGEDRRLKILEIGVDTGISLFALHNNLSMLGVEFEYTGVDIKIQNHVNTIAEDYMFFKLENTKITLREENSLSFLENLVKSGGEKFDIILIDGDHNYYTVSRECSFIKDLMHDNTLLVFDDYTGDYENNDFFYADRESYKENTLATENKSEVSEKTGVRPAVDEFIEENNLESFKLMYGEPLVAISKENTILENVEIIKFEE